MENASTLGSTRIGQGLTIASWANLIAAIEASMAVGSVDDLKQWLRGHLAGVLPHRGYYCAVGPISGSRLRERLAIDEGGVDRYLARYRIGADELTTPAFRRWLIRNTAQTDADLDPADQACLRGEGIDRLLAFGVVDRAGGLSSYCELAGVRVLAEPAATYAAELLAPQLHATLLRLSARVPTGREVDCPEGRLTPREKEVLRWISEGKSVWETAKILGRSEHTIKNQVRRVYSKLGIHTRVQAARIADRLLGTNR